MALVQVMPESDSWKVLLDGTQQGGSYTTQEEADQEGRAIAKANGAEYQLHGEDATVRAKDSYGNDPRPIEG